MSAELDKLHDDLDKFQYVRAKMRDEGLHYCFESYSSFEEVDDPEFHKLRKAYLRSAKKLQDHVNNRIKQINEDILEHGE